MKTVISKPLATQTVTKAVTPSVNSPVFKAAGGGGGAVPTIEVEVQWGDLTFVAWENGTQVSWG